MFIETLKLSAGKYVGRPFILRDWQKNIIRTWFRLDEDGKRKVKYGLLSIGRKNGKSELIAGIALAIMSLKSTRLINGQGIISACTREQASLIFRIVSYFIMADTYLLKQFRIIPSSRRIIHLETDSDLKVVVLDGSKMMGSNIFMAILDEFGSYKPNIGRDFYASVNTALSAQENPLIMMLSTQAPDESHPFSELVDYSKNINSGLIEDPTFSGFIFETPKDADIFDEKNWYLSNPALDDFKSLEDMRDQAVRARKIPSAEASFRNLMLNQRVDSVTPFISKSIWEKNIAKDLTIDFKENDAFIGIDLSQTTDLTAITLIFPHEVNGIKKYREKTLIFKPEDTLEVHENRDRVPYRLWARQGFLKTTPGKTIDYRFIALELQLLAEQFQIKAGYFDRWKFPELKRELEDIELSLPIEPLGQGYQSISPCVDFFETTLLNEQLEHSQNPLLTWCASNCVISIDPAGNRKLDKGKSRSRIDPIVSLIMALRAAQVYSLEHEENPGSIYDDEEFVKSLGGVWE